MKVKDIIGSNSEWMPNQLYDTVKPLVTVILPICIDAENYALEAVEKCIDSILAQSLRRLELIIIIDGLADEIIDLCQNYMKQDSRVNLIFHREKTNLPAVCIYEAYIKAKGDYIAYAAYDTVWELDALARTYDYMEINSVRACYGIIQVRNQNTGNAIEIGSDGNLVEKMLWAENSIGLGNIVLHREVLERVGLQDPHLALSKFYDWDLWIRVSNYYRFVATGIPFAVKNKAECEMLVGADRWFCCERQQHRDVLELLPKNYENVDISEYIDQNSAHYMHCLKECYGQYLKNSWFNQQEFSGICNAGGNRSHRYILVCTQALTASLMNFTRKHSNDITFCYVMAGQRYYPALVMCDVAIAVRSPKILPAADICKLLQIPCYYFTDDNFREIAAVSCEDPGIKEAADLTNQEYLSRFEGILVTTTALKEYFLTKNLHDNVILLPPVWRESLKIETRSDSKTIAFMGGFFRQGILLQCVLPALYSIAKEQTLRLILPCTKSTEKSVRELAKYGLKIVPFFRTDNYEFLMNAYSYLEPDVLIHCGGNLRNNSFKTKNALINAVTLNVPLLVSDIEPYCDQSDGSEGAYLLTRNTPDAWEESLRRLIDDSALRQSMITKAEAFCREHYDSVSAWDEMNREFSKIPDHDLFFYLKRYEQLYNWMAVNTAVREPVSGSSGGARVYDPENLSFTGELGETRRFGFTAAKEVINEIGLLFAVSGECSGTVELAFFKRRHIDPEIIKTLSIEELVKNGYTSFVLDNPITAKQGELIYLDVTVKYEKKNGYVGLFEDRSRRTFIYKVFNKLGRPIPGRDAIFIDCRS